MTICSMTDGCLAVNVIGNHEATCELTTGLSNENEMQDAPDSELFVLGEYLSLTLRSYTSNANISCRRITNMII